MVANTSAFRGPFLRCCASAFRVASSHVFCACPGIAPEMNPGFSAAFEYRPTICTYGASSSQYTAGWFIVCRKIVPAIGGTVCEGAQKFAWNALQVVGSVLGNVSPS